MRPTICPRWFAIELPFRRGDVLTVKIQMLL